MQVAQVLATPAMLRHIIRLTLALLGRFSTDRISIAVQDGGYRLTTGSGSLWLRSPTPVLPLGSTTRSPSSRYTLTIAYSGHSDEIETAAISEQEPHPEIQDLAQT